MISFTIVAIILFGLLHVMWKKSDYFNLIIKVALLGMTIWGVVVALKQAGWIG